MCAPVSAVGVNALGSQVGNPASNAIDKNLNTRWSNEGLGSWIQIDLGEKKVVCLKHVPTCQPLVYLQSGSQAGFPLQMR